MSVKTEVSSLNATLQQTHEWLVELAQEGSFNSEAQAYSALRAVLHALRDRLTVEEASHLASNLPMLVRGFYYEGWRPALAPNRLRDLDSFLEHVAHSLRGASIEPMHATQAVFAFLQRKLPQGELRDIRQSLPAEIRGIWPG